MFGCMHQVVELKVGLHCEECIKKILKAIKKIEGNSNLYLRNPLNLFLLFAKTILVRFDSP